ncbi:hypothetical protein Nepgr_008580 [Nepenthes gracilis]|uniref:Uncharacterized protein n=1 Tax=Nepenthes gracilis TaxID=150966 RepID=A0AAD3S8Y5_NEPGR|nr:hypothetical protein Nepgr_008580 [Nepenthes gracilis]
MLAPVSFKINAALEDLFRLSWDERELQCLWIVLSFDSLEFQRRRGKLRWRGMYRDLDPRRTGVAEGAGETEVDHLILLIPTAGPTKRDLKEVLMKGFNIRRKSRSISPRSHKSRSRTPKHGANPSYKPMHYRRHQSNNSSFSPQRKSHSPSLGSVERKNATEKLKHEEEERQRRQQEAELKLIEEETVKRVEAAIQKKVAERLESEEIKVEIRRVLEDGRKKVREEVAAQLAKEREAAVIDARRKEELAHKEKEKLERILEENRRRLEEPLRMEALERQRKEEERYRELEELQRQKEEAMRRKKQQEEEERAKQMILLGKNKSRPKLSFAINTK